MRQQRRETNKMHLLRTIEGFLKETGMAATRFGRNAVRDPRLVLDMRNGREPGARMVRRVEHFITRYRADRQEQAGR
jgi:2,4-dienoyl-CoA reductase-like NADH-dependent reductase (Old Yellow Enzyme family)